MNPILQRLCLLGGATTMALLAGCYNVNSLVDAPDANPGDGVCARAAPGFSPGQARRVGDLRQLQQDVDSNLTPEQRARLGRGDLSPLAGQDLKAGRLGVREALGPDAGRRLASPLGLCTLRAAIMEANAQPWKSVITVPAGIYKLSPALGTLTITRSLRLQGSGADTTTVDAQSGDTVFAIDGGGDVEMNHLTVRGASAFSGGGIRITAGSVELEDMVVRDNDAYSAGGGLLIYGGATVRVRRSTIRDNTSAFGGGIRSDGRLWVYDSTIRDNQGNRGGGIMNGGDMNLRNVTISGNWADSPVAGVGGIWQGKFAFLNNVTITKNRGMGNAPGSWQGGGIQTSAGANTVLRNSIVADNDGQTGPDDCVGTLAADSRNNLIGDTTACTITSYLSTYLLNVDADLGSLMDNGGPTATHRPNNASPVHEAGYAFPPPAADACEAYDQRGVPRPQGSTPRCDLGAYEQSASSTRVTGFMLVNAGTDTDIRPLLHDDWLVLSTLPPQLTIRAVSGGVVPGSVRFGYAGNPAHHTENTAPYALAGDVGGDYAPIALTAGAQELRATPYEGANASGAPGISKMIRFNVLE